MFYRIDSKYDSEKKMLEPNGEIKDFLLVHMHLQKVGHEIHQYCDGNFSAAP